MKKDKKNLESKFEIIPSDKLSLEELMLHFNNFENYSIEERLNFIRDYTSYIASQLNLSDVKCAFVDFSGSDTQGRFKYSTNTILINQILLESDSVDKGDLLFRLGSFAHELLHAQDYKLGLNLNDYRYVTHVPDNILSFINKTQGNISGRLIDRYYFYRYTQFPNELHAREYEVKAVEEMYKCLLKLNSSSREIEEKYNNIKNRELSFFTGWSTYSNKAEDIKKIWKKAILSSLKNGLEERENNSIYVKNTDIAFSNLLHYAFIQKEIFDDKVFKQVYDTLLKEFKNNKKTKISKEAIAECISTMVVFKLDNSPQVDKKGIKAKQEIFDEWLTNALSVDSNLLDNVSGRQMLKTAINSDEIVLTIDQLKAICIILKQEEIEKLFVEENRYSEQLQEIRQELAVLEEINQMERSAQTINNASELEDVETNEIEYINTL